MFIIYISKLSDITMKAIKWAGAGASLLDPVSAHLITPKYEHELPSGNGKCGAACRCCCVPVLLRASGTRPATTEAERRPRVQQRAEWNVDRLLSTDRSGSVDCRRHGAIWLSCVVEPRAARHECLL